jgi:hypothetical protein
MASGVKRRTGRARAKARETFLSHFAANCNVAAAAAAAGVSAPALYRWRRDEPDFAAAWDEALEMGYQLLEARLVAHALDGDCGGALNGIAPIAAAPIEVELALKLMALHRQNAAKGVRGRPPKPVPREDMMKVLLARIELIEQRRRAKAEREAAERAEAEQAAPAPPLAITDGSERRA